VKSHQNDTDIPHAVIVQGNVQQDIGRTEARCLPPPKDVRYPTGGFFAAMVRSGSLFAEAPRHILRREALAKWQLRPVQGKLATAYRTSHMRSMDLRFYTTCAIEDRWTRWGLAKDRPKAPVQNVVPGTQGHRRKLYGDAVRGRRPGRASCCVATDKRPANSPGVPAML
jgi:hypothetical protein